MLTYIFVLKNNYIWFLNDEHKFCIIIDPGESKHTLSYIEKNKWIPVAILITHYHRDHTDGINNILNHFPKIKIYEPLESKYSKNNCIVYDNDTINILNYKIQVIKTPGHTKEHVSYYTYPYLFCGDTIFSGGCGKVADNLYQQMYHSIRKISSLPNDVIICCGHEYTYSNILFSTKMIPLDKKIKKYFLYLKKQKHKKNYISTIKNEKKINIFFKMNNIKYQKYKNFKYLEFYTWDYFEFIRKLKNKF